MNYTYEKKVETLVSYFKKCEKDPLDFKLGLELEHFLLEEDSYRAVPYSGDKGVEGFLQALLAEGWEGIYEGESLLALKGKNMHITLEPGGQLELSLVPARDIKEIEEIYQVFLNTISPILKDRGQVLVNLGYQPVSKIAEIPLLPKERYKYMYNYFKSKGKYAHNMMKGTSSIQLSLDYSSEEDLRKKIRVVYFLAPLVYYFFDNSPFFEGKLNEINSLRSLIWDNCDDDRSGYVLNVFNDDFTYYDYAHYILNMPPIIIMKNRNLLYTAEKQNKDIGEIDFRQRDEVDHLLTMAFPDARVKKYLEIRMGDSIPYPYNLAYVLFWQGLLYNNKNLDSLYEKALNYSQADLDRVKEDIYLKGSRSRGYGPGLEEFYLSLLELAQDGLENRYEKEYLEVLRELVLDAGTPREKTIRKLKRGNELKKALEWCKAGGGVSIVG